MDRAGNPHWGDPGCAEHPHPDTTLIQTPLPSLSSPPHSLPSHPPLHTLLVLYLPTLPVPLETTVLSWLWGGLADLWLGQGDPSGRVCRCTWLTGSGWQRGVRLHPMRVVPLQHLGLRSRRWQRREEHHDAVARRVCAGHLRPGEGRHALHPGGATGGRRLPQRKCPGQGFSSTLPQDPGRPLRGHQRPTLLLGAPVQR